MQYRRLGRTDLMAAEVGIGARTLARLPAEEAAGVIRAAVTAGSNLIEVDTDAPAELAALALVLKPLRPQLLVVGAGSTDRATVEAAMTTLNLDYFDCYLATAPTPDLGETQVLAAAGLARSVGVGTTSMSDALSAILDGGVEVVQVPFNLFEVVDPTGIDAVLTAARDADVGVLACAPLAGGRLGARADTSLLERLAFLTDGVPQSVAQAAIAWALSDLRVSAVVTGPRTERDAYESAAASFIAPLDAATLERLATVLSRE